MTHLPNRTPAQARFCHPLAEDTRWELRVTDVTPNRKAPVGAHTRCG